MKLKFRELLICCILIGLTLSYLIYNSIDNFLIKKEIIYNSNLNNLPVPTQINFKNPINEDIYVGKQLVNIQKLAKYEIKGVVMSLQRYSTDPVSKTDIVLGWGPFTLGKNYDKYIDMDILNDRFSYGTFDLNWANSVGGYEYVRNSYSNNHLIPSNDKIKRLIEKISLHDYLQISGYLVYATWQTPSGTYFWGPSSMTRNDTGNGACEIILIDNIKWLKE